MHLPQGLQRKCKDGSPSTEERRLLLPIPMKSKNEKKKKVKKKKKRTYQVIGEIWVHNTIDCPGVKLEIYIWLQMWRESCLLPGVPEKELSVQESLLLVGCPCSGGVLHYKAGFPSVTGCVTQEPHSISSSHFRIVVLNEEKTTILEVLRRGQEIGVSKRMCGEKKEKKSEKKGLTFFWCTLSTWEQSQMGSLQDWRAQPRASAAPPPSSGKKTAIPHYDRGIESWAVQRREKEGSHRHVEGGYPHAMLAPFVSWTWCPPPWRNLWREREKIRSKKKWKIREKKRKHTWIHQALCSSHLPLDGHKPLWQFLLGDGKRISTIDNLSLQ